jgi:hypothetical protein
MILWTSFFFIFLHEFLLLLLSGVRQERTDTEREKYPQRAILDGSTTVYILFLMFVRQNIKSPEIPVVCHYGNLGLANSLGLCSHSSIENVEHTQKHSITLPGANIWVEISR